MARTIQRFYHRIIIAVILCGTGLIFGTTHREIAHAGITPDKVICRVETDRKVLPSGGPQDVILKVSLEAPPAPAGYDRPRINLALVLDQSGSMNGKKITHAKAAAVEAVGRLSGADIFSVVVYDTNIHTIIPARHAENQDRIIDRIQQIRAEGSTALFGGVSQGAAEIRKNIGNDYVHRIVLLSDGLANVGPRTPGDLGRLGAALIKENISVTTVGVGMDYNEDLMAQLAQKSDGNTYFVESAYDLPAIFSSELGEVLNVVAKKVNVTISLPDAVEPMEIIGREGRIVGQQIQLYMNQLYGTQEKYALVKVRVPASRAGATLKVASADVTYENPFTQKQERSGGVSYASFTQDLKKAEMSVNVDVVREYQLNMNAIAQEKAIELSDKGQKEEAVEALKQSAAKLKTVGARYKDAVLLKEARELEIQAESIQDTGMDKKSRKVLRTRSYQMKNQQVSQ